MKKGKVLGKSQIAVIAMLIALGGAIWLNMKYTDTTKYLGQATYVSKKANTASAAETSAKIKENDYFEEVKEKREQARKEESEVIEETLKSEKLTDDQKDNLTNKTTNLADRLEKEANIESLLKAKGFNKSVAFINDGGIIVVVKANDLTSSQTLQIQDIITSQTDIAVKNIKIITVK